MFQYFKLKSAERKPLAEQPKDTATWIKHGISEFIGTIVLAIMLAGLSTVAAGTDKVAEAYFLHPFLVGMYAGFLAIGFLLFVFLRWSCDLNPAVTITRMLKGTNTYKYGFFKIAIQFTAAIVAGLIIYGLGSLGEAYKANGEQIHNHAILASGAASKSLLFKDFNVATSEASGALWIFFGEMIMMAILLYSVFSRQIKDKYRDFAIMFIIAMDVWMGILLGSAAINPARGLSQQVPGLFFGAEAGNADHIGDIVKATIAMEAGTLFAPFLFVFLQGFVESYVNPMIHKAIAFKNFRSTNMRIDIQEDLEVDGRKSDETIEAEVQDRVEKEQKKQD